MFANQRQRNEGFSMIELVVVVVIIGIIAAIAIPRLSRGSAGAADAALHGNLAVMRTAIDQYAAEHGGAFPTVANVVAQLTQYTDDSGDAVAAKDTTHIYGPYIRKIPPLPVGAKKGKTGINDIDGATIGWIYTETPGTIKANTTALEMDEQEVPYNTY